jgi:hypothetical protein
MLIPTLVKVRIRSFCYQEPTPLGPRSRQITGPDVCAHLLSPFCSSRLEFQGYSTVLLSERLTDV